MPICRPTFTVLYCLHPKGRRHWQPTMMVDMIDRVLVDEETLQARIKELGQMISADYAAGDLVLICVLKGGVAFLTDLMRHITVPHEIDFLAISSYGAGQRESTGAVRLLMDLKADIAGRDVLIVEDIVDSGQTMEYLVRTLGARQPASLRICTLLSKPSRREVDVSLDYIGFEIPNEFVLGYGLDLDEKYRNLPYVAVLKQEFYGGLPN